LVAGLFRGRIASQLVQSDAVETFGDASEAVIAQHHWPVFGKERARNFLINQRDLYKYEHDQTVRLMNQGFTAPEIAEQLELPASLANEWENRGYYGTVRHNFGSEPAAL
jgi:linear primary-alkylsulfatase